MTKTATVADSKIRGKILLSCGQQELVAYRQFTLRVLRETGVSAEMKWNKRRIEVKIRHGSKTRKIRAWFGNL